MCQSIRADIEEKTFRKCKNEKLEETEDSKPLLHVQSPQTSSEFNNVTPASEINLDEGKTRRQSFFLTELSDNTKDDTDSEDDEDTASVDANIEDFLMTSIINSVHGLSKESSRKKTITFLDFAGHSMYYAFHHLYLSPETLSILVVDMNKEFKMQCKADENFCGKFTSWTYEGKNTKY